MSENDDEIRDVTWLAAQGGITLAPEEQEALSAAMARDASGQWAQFRVTCGQGDVILARELAGLFLLDERILHVCSSHRRISEVFDRLLGCITSEPELSRRVIRISRAHGAETLRTQAGGEIRFPSPAGARGIRADLVILDNPGPHAEEAVIPCLTARPGAQLWVR